MDNSNVDTVVGQIVAFLTVYGIRVIGAILILIVGRIAAGILAGAVQKAMRQAKIEESLVGFVAKLARIAVILFAVIAALGKFGIQTASFVAILGAAGLAIGFALQGSLSNFAAGVMILIFRPFRVGDFVDAAGSMGSVLEIGIFTTTLKTPDNKKIIVPNSKIMGSTITNVNAFDTRRVDLVAGISYGDDISKAKQVLTGIVNSHAKILKDPAPKIEVLELADSSVNFVVRPWVNTPDYWTVYFDVTRMIKEEFDRNGISIPFPQRDVHMHQIAAQN